MLTSRSRAFTTFVVLIAGCSSNVRGEADANADAQDASDGSSNGPDGTTDVALDGSDGPTSTDVARSDVAPDAAACLRLTFDFRTVPMNQSVWHLAVGDLDGDGDLDVLANDTVVLNDGHGTLTPGASIVANANSPFNGPVLADVNQDGRLDVVGTPLSQIGVQVQLAGAGATFGAPIASLGTTPVFFLATAHIDGDARPDLVFMDTQVAAHVAIALGNGDGTFGAAFDQAISSAGALAIGDVDLDGRDDVLVGEGAYGAPNGPMSGVLPLFGTGSTMLRPGPFVASGTLGVQWIATGDIDGDGRIDLAAESDVIDALRPGSNGSLADIPSGVISPMRGPSLAVGDLDRDGHADVAVVAGIDSGAVEILHATGGDTFDASFSFGIGRQPTYVAGGDFDGDGVWDLVAATRDSMDIVVMLSRPMPQGTATERSCSTCGGASDAGTNDNCSMLP